MRKEFKNFVEELIREEEEVSLEEIGLKITDLLKRVLPSKTYINVEPYKGMASRYLAIEFAASSDFVSGTRGERPQLVSLCLNSKLELQVQMYGGAGGNMIYRRPDKSKDSEKHYAMVGIKIPFRKPQPNEKSVLQAVENFAKAWVKALKDNADVLV